MAAKIKKIKREMLAELGDGFETLSDAEAKESGIELADDEVLVVATAQPPVPPKTGEGEDEKDRTIADLRSRLHSANQESASRRIALRESEQKMADLTGQVTKLTDDLSGLKTNKAKEEAAVLFTDYVKEKGINFISEEAAADAREAVFAGLKWDAPVTKEIIGPAVDGFVDKKKYLVTEVKLPRTDGGRQSQVPAGELDVDLDDIAREFNLPNYEKTQKESG